MRNLEANGYYNAAGLKRFLQLNSMITSQREFVTWNI